MASNIIVLLNAITTLAFFNNSWPVPPKIILVPSFLNLLITLSFSRIPVFVFNH